VSRCVASSRCIPNERTSRPMATNVLMPKWGMSMQEGQVNSWLKKEGDPVEQGEALVEVESEKATNFIEAPASGESAPSGGGKTS